MSKLCASAKLALASSTRLTCLRSNHCSEVGRRAGALGVTSISTEAGDDLYALPALTLLVRSDVRAVVFHSKQSHVINASILPSAFSVGLLQLGSKDM